MILIYYLFSFPSHADPHGEQMEQYWRPRAPTNPTTSTGTTQPTRTMVDRPVMSDFDKYRLTLISPDDGEDWMSEKRRYLKEMPTDILRKSDIIQWWQVRYLPICYHFLCSNLTS